ncbi:2OG-Fe dioxygenase family protein [Sphingobium bisphenolivorans]|uniref:2OG-Fe dioxygenase family protein n=1 Tax=Sphingobium bisphenolivorans TaxID=1335760 RepID=UPI0004890068|nr:2OG-Fe dioxygenase family protein [Sphingobium bisphenolivorans]
MQHSPIRPDLAALRGEIAATGYIRLEGSEVLPLLAPDPADWDRFARSWGDLGPDLYMADGGRYRRRRHASFAFDGGAFIRKPHQPHFQSRDYNPLNGDVQRWFDPIEQSSIDNPVMQAIFTLCAAAFDMAGPQHVEAHQFRIEAQAGELGRPTPEGMHRDGVDWVFVMLIERRNVREGVTRIGAPEGGALGEFTLAAPGDAVLLDDHRILHGVTEIHPLDPSRPAWRDALVVTFVADR